MPRLLFSFLCACLAATPVARAQDNSHLVRVCNGEGAVSNAWVKEVYAHFPAMPPNDDCLRERELLNKIASDRSQCDWLLMYSASWYVCTSESDKKRDALVSRCDTIRKRVSDQAAGLNALIPSVDVPFLIPWPTKTYLVSTEYGRLYADYTVTVDPNVPGGVAFASPNGRTTVWTALAFDAVAVGKAANLTGACSTPISGLDCSTSWLMRPDDGGALSGVALGVSEKSLRLSLQQSLLPDVQFAPGLKQQTASPDGNLVRTAGSNNAWAFALPGCALPVVTLRVKWEYRQQAVYGQTYSMAETTLGTNGLRTIGCWGRRLTVMRVAPTPMTTHGKAMLCSQRGVDSNTLRRMLADPVYGATDTLRRAATLEYVMRQAWAVRADSALTVPFTEAYAQALLACAQPSGSSTSLGGTWAGHAPGTVGSSSQGWPGMCMTCTGGGAGNALSLMQNNQQVRACNRSIAAEKGLDCCVGCRYVLTKHTHIHALTYSFVPLLPLNSDMQVS